MAVDYYLVLGVPRHAVSEQIKRAYEALSLQHHPGRTGWQTRETFTRITEAYQVLIDPRHRREYDRTLPPASSMTALRAAAERTPRQRTARFVSPPEPITGKAVNPFTSFRSYRPSFDEIFETYRQNFLRRPPAKHHLIRDLNLEIILTPAEAAAGGRLPLEVPVAATCHRCNGTGRAGFSLCDACDGHGLRWQRRQLDVLIPPRLRDRIMIPVSLRHLGVQNMILNVHLRVASPAPAGQAPS